jgi:hypothetical protein
VPGIEILESKVEEKTEDLSVIEEMREDCGTGFGWKLTQLRGAEDTIVARGADRHLQLRVSMDNIRRT